MTPRLVLATANRDKAVELRALLGDIGYAIATLRDYPALALPPESGSSYAENALGKARTTAATTGTVAVGDDSGLEVDALGGRPGLASARYGSPGLTDAERVAWLLAELAGVRSRRARFRCVLALVAPWGEEAVVEGVTEGHLTERPQGARGFGYDPIFLLPELGRTFAELVPADKARVSHRGQAAGQARPILARWAARATREGQSA